MATPRRWWETLFDEKYLVTYVDLVTKEKTRSQLEFLERTIGLPPGARILDLGCGYGRLSVPLSERGYRVTGLDFSDHFLDLAKQRARERDQRIALLRADMRRFAFDGAFDGVISMFTSFGYFESRDEDIEVLKNVYRALKPGGRLVLDFVNTPRAIGFIYEKGDVDESTGEIVAHRTDVLSNGLEVDQRDRLDVWSMRWRMRRRWTEEDRERSYESDVRMYLFPELRELTERAGLEFRCVYGNFEGGPYRADTDRMILVVAKPQRTGE